MKHAELCAFLDRLDLGIHPTTLQPFDLASSPLGRRPVADALRTLRLTLSGEVASIGRDASSSAQPSPPPGPEATSANPATVARDTVAAPTAADLRRAAAELRSLGYHPTTPQVGKLLRGGRSIADPSLRGLESYALYRGMIGKREMARAVEIFARGNPEVIQPTNADATALPTKPAKRDEPWRDVTFFAEARFDVLDEDKAAELATSVGNLGLRKVTDKLPEYMAKARVRYPRCYEPWTREERGILVEAMCYTNDADKLAPLFGRSAGSLRSAGQRLIYESRTASAKAG